MTAATAARRGIGVPKKKTAAERTAERMQTATDLAARIAANQAQAAILNATVKADRTKLDAVMESLKVAPGDSIDLEGPDGEALHVSRVQASSDSVDEGKLRNLLGANLWRKVTRAVLDTGLLEARVADGTVDPKHVAQCTETSYGKPFVKVSTKGTPKRGSE